MMLGAFIAGIVGGQAFSPRPPQLAATTQINAPTFSPAADYARPALPEIEIEYRPGDSGI
jgi:hypothetical protein